MKTIEIEITKKECNRTVKSILFDDLKMSKRLVTRLKKGDGIKVNDEHSTVRRVVCEGDILKISFFEEQNENIVANDISLDIVYEDDEILVVNKPSDMPTHPSINHYEGTLANAVMHKFKDTKFVFRAINRLDADTTGLVIIAKNQYSANELNRQIRNREIKKVYLAICCGKLPYNSGTVEKNIKRAQESVIKRIVSDDGQYAKTDYEVLEYKDGFSLVKLRLHTGRTHQIRVHMAYINAPLYADFIYGEGIENERVRLHCYSLEFSHPVTKEKMVFKKDAPDDFFIKVKL